MENNFSNFLNISKPNDLATFLFKFLVSLGGTILAISAALAEISDSEHFLNILRFDLIKIYVILINLLFAVAIYYLGEPTKTGWDEEKIKEAIKKSAYFSTIRRRTTIFDSSIREIKTYFSKYWIYLWGSWTLLYLVLFSKSIWGLIIGFSPTVTPYSLIFTLIENSLNYASSYFLIALYLILLHKASEKSKQDENISYHRNKNRVKFFFWGLILAELSCYLSIYIFSSSYSEGKLFIGNYEVFASRIHEVSFIFELINGLIGSVALAVFVGRLIGSQTTVLQHKHTLYLPLLYLYCAIQPFFVFISDDRYRNCVIGILIIALTGKYYLYKSVTRLLDTKRLLFHFIETIAITNNVTKKFESFQKIWTQDSPQELEPVNESTT